MKCVIILKFFSLSKILNKFVDKVSYKSPKISRYTYICLIIVSCFQCSSLLVLQIYTHSMGLTGSTQKMDSTEQKLRDEIDEQIAKYKIFMISKKSCPFCRTAKVSLQKYH